MKFLLSIFLLSIAFNSFSVDMVAKENSLVTIFKKIKNLPTYEEQFKQSELFKTELWKLLAYDEAFDYEFPELSKFMSVAKASDNKFKLFNWNVEKPNGEQWYGALVLHYNKRKKTFEITELYDKSGSLIIEPHKKNLDNRRWYGALYYKIIPIQKGGRTYYTVLGWDGNDRLSSKKIIDVMSFSGSKIKFGAPIFRVDGEWFRRYIMEYNSKAAVSMKFYETKKTKDIVFDHVSPPTPQFEGKKHLYAPDGSTDAFKFENGKWIMYNDVNQTNGKSIRDKQYTNPEEVDPNKL